jgi:hypothetical protein
VNGRLISLRDYQLGRDGGAKWAFKINEAEQSAAADCLQRPLLGCSRFWQQLSLCVRLRTAELANQRSQRTSP